MKKALILFLTLILCLSLCACGSSKKYEKYDKLIEYIESGNSLAVYGEIQRLMSKNDNDENTELEIVELTVDNWKEYFEIRPYETKQYNDFGDLTVRQEGHAFYLKSEHLAVLSDGHPDLNGRSVVDVSFKVNATMEYREYNNETKEFVEGGRVHSTEKLETVVEIHNLKNNKNTEEYVSTGNGQVWAQLWDGSGRVEGGRHYESYFTDDITVIDVTGTLAFERPISTDTD